MEAPNEDYQEEKNKGQNRVIDPRFGPEEMPQTGLVWWTSTARRNLWFV